MRDLAIQKQMDDLVIGTFGRSIYVLDDYSPLRELTPKALEREAVLCPVRDAHVYIPTRQYGVPGKGFQGAAFYTADNPPFGAVFTYHLKETIKTAKQKRRDLEKAAAKKDAATPYPSKDQMRAEAEEEAPVILLTVSDANGKPLRTLTGPVSQGIHRIAWDLREPGPVLPKPAAKEPDEDVFSGGPQGPLVVPGAYRVALAKRVGGIVTPVDEPRELKVVFDGPKEALEEFKELHAFQQKVLRLQRAVAGTLEAANELTTRLDRIKRTLDQSPQIDAKWKALARDLENRNRAILRALRGDGILRCAMRIRRPPLATASATSSPPTATRWPVRRRPSAIRMRLPVRNSPLS